jgi:hypothetical protein
VERPARDGTDLTRFIVASTGVTVEHGDPNR